MLFTNTEGRQSNGEQGQATSEKIDEKSLTYMIYFFASQMPQNIQVVKDSRTPSSLVDGKSSPVYAHRLDDLLSEVKRHAHLSPFVSRFETFPVEMPPGPPKNTSREVMHDTMLLVGFLHKRACEQWTTTKEWQRFMEKTERERVFRREPHVRCASSLRGLSDLGR